MRDDILIQFADTSVPLKEFRVGMTYAGHLEGTFESCSRHILMDDYLHREQGLCLILNGKLVDWRKLYKSQRFGEHFFSTEPLPPDAIVLGRYVYKLRVESDCEHHLTVKWYSDLLDIRRPITDIIQEVTSKLDYSSHCKYTSMADF